MFTEDVQVLLASIFLQSNHNEKRFEPLYKKLSTQFADILPMCYSSEEVYKMIETNELNFFVLRKTRRKFGRGDGYSFVQLSKHQGVLMVMQEVFNKTIDLLLGRVSDKHLTFLTEARAILQKKTTIKSEFPTNLSFQPDLPVSNSPTLPTALTLLPFDTLPNLLIGTSQYNMVPLGPAPAGYQYDPNWMPFRYEYVPNPYTGSVVLSVLSYKCE